MDEDSKERLGDAREARYKRGKGKAGVKKKASAQKSWTAGDGTGEKKKKINDDRKRKIDEENKEKIVKKYLEHGGYVPGYAKEMDGK